MRHAQAFAQTSVWSSLSQKLFEVTEHCESEKVNNRELVCHFPKRWMVEKRAWGLRVNRKIWCACLTMRAVSSSRADICAWAHISPGLILTGGNKKWEVKTGRGRVGDKMRVWTLRCSDGKREGRKWEDREEKNYVHVQYMDIQSIKVFRPLVCFHFVVILSVDW